MGSLADRIEYLLTHAGMQNWQKSVGVLADVRELERKANRWDGFIGCARVSLFGSAGFDFATGLPKDGDHIHFGADFWTTHPECAQPLRDETTALITAFADASYRNLTKTGAIK